ncbi:hypothetical protein [Nocardioides caldifontis]|uniref:hypothetical protein n=1 Tax=Nocardioides caldifontis TaxID=2588938 RepID=UPI0011DF032A|nr:hypothetical protein [Nocardioides caldifontis]
MRGLPARYRTTTWLIGVVLGAALGAWLVAVVSGLVLTGEGLALGALAGAAVGVVVVHAFLTVLFHQAAAPDTPAVDRHPRVG